MSRYQPNVDRSDSHARARVRVLRWALLLALGCGASVAPVTAGSAYDPPDEVYLSFRYRALGNMMVTALHADGAFYLPITGLFGSFLVDLTVDLERLRVHGTYIDDRRPYDINLTEQFVQVADHRIELEADDFVVGEFDLYLRSQLFEEAFGLRFRINRNNLSLALSTDETLPIVHLADHRSRRARTEVYAPGREYGPLLHPRRQQFIGGGMLDYAVTTNISSEMQTASSTIGVGGQFLGGDLQGSINASHRPGLSTLRLQNVRWRQAVIGSPLVSFVSIGQLLSSGLRSDPVTGVRVTNEPIQPRILFGDYVVDGTAEPESEVELYLNNRLLEYTRADELGYYRFTVPLTYGTSQLRIVEITPAGAMIESVRRLQVPFSFLPAGHVHYTVLAGQSAATSADLEPALFAQASANIGLTSRITGRLGVEQAGPVDGIPVVQGGLSARIGNSHLLNVEAAPAALYRMRASGLFDSGASWSLGATSFVPGGEFATGGLRSEIQGDAFIPLSVAGLPLTLRMGALHVDMTDQVLWRVTADASARIRLLGLRLAVRDVYVRRATIADSHDRFVSAIATYSIPRLRRIHPLLRGTYLRAQADAAVETGSIERVDLQLARTFGQRARLALTGSRQMGTGQTVLQATFALDLNPARVTTAARLSDDRLHASQSIRGGVAYDAAYHRPVFDSRQQVGRAAASVRLFVDRNGSGTFDEGDEVIPDNAVRLDRSAVRRIDESGITRLSQLQPYTRYNLSINAAAIRNPTYVPLDWTFSFIADPNVHKQIDVPFYVAGIVEGTVVRQLPSGTMPLGGVRVVLSSVEGAYRTVLQTFSDGSFYAMEIPPGRYTVEVDPAQLALLNMRSEPSQIEFEVRPTGDGDLVEGLDFVLVPAGD